VRTKHNYRNAIAVIREVIHKWDPYRLLACGAPEDEFDAEVRAIVRQIPRINSTEDAIHAVSRVFTSSFEPGVFKPDDCKEVGKEIYKALKEHGLLK
jgi:hypothetical protein